MTATEQDLRAIAYLVKRLRDETLGANKWDDNGVWAELKLMLGHNLAITIERACRHAADPEAKTPGSVRRPFLPDAPKDDNTARPAKRDQECRKHPGQWPGSCGPCATEKFTAFHDEQVEHWNANQSGRTVAEAKAEARAAIEATRLAAKAPAATDTSTEVSA